MQLRTIPISATISLLVLTVAAVGVVMKVKERVQIVQAFTNVENGTATSLIDYLIPSEWPWNDVVTTDINTLAPAQSILPGIVEDPDESSVTYFATVAEGTAKNTIVTSIYRYNTLNFTFSRLYRRVEAAGDVLRVVGYDNNALIVVFDDPTEERHACSDVDFFSLSLVDPGAGLSAYTLPDALVASAAAHDVCKSTP